MAAGGVKNALDANHEENIKSLHIKPDNVLITAENHVTIIDFGMSHQFCDSDMSQSAKL